MRVFLSVQRVPGYIFLGPGSREATRLKYEEYLLHWLEPRLRHAARQGVDIVLTHLCTHTTQTAQLSLVEWQNVENPCPILSRPSRV